MACARPVSLGHFPDVFVTDGFETADVHHLFDPLLHGVPPQSMELGGELKGVEGIHIEIQRIHLREIADLLPDGERMLPDIHAVDVDRAGCRGHIAGNDLHCRCFPGPVGTEKTEDLAGLDIKGDIIDGRTVPIPLHKVTHTDRHGVSKNVSGIVA
jgi:hypothetical protein